MTLSGPARQPPALLRTPPAEAGDRLRLDRSCACKETGEQCPRCAGKAQLQPAGGNGVVPSCGEPLDQRTRHSMEQRFAEDFSQVRIHSDSQAATAAGNAGARAFTIGNNIVFGEGRYAPTSGDGRQLLAHELTHVVQQRRGAIRPPGGADNPEREAVRVGSEISRGVSHVTVMEGASVGIARQEETEVPRASERC